MAPTSTCEDSPDASIEAAPTTNATSNADGGELAVGAFLNQATCGCE